MTSKNKAPEAKKGKQVSETIKSRPYQAWGLALFAFILYVFTVNNAYNLDDELVTKNHPVTGKGISALPEIFASPYFADASGNAYEYRPVVLTSFAIEHQFFGDNPGVSHFFNALLYALLIWVLYKTLKALWRNYNGLLPFCVALLFAAHPLHTEVVASIKNRDEILALLFALLSLYTSLQYVKAGQWKFLAISALLFLLGILSKKSVLPFALIIPLSLILFSKSNLKQLLTLAGSLAFIGAVTSYFFDINIRLLFFIAIILATLFFWYLNEAASISQIKENFITNIKKHFKNPLISPALDSEESQVVGSMQGYYFFCTLVFIAGVINNSAIILFLGLIAGTVFYIFYGNLKHDVLLIPPFFMAVALLSQTGIVSPVLLMAVFLFSRFDFRNKFHLVMLFSMVVPLLWNFERHMVFLFYFFLIAVLMFLARADKWKLVYKILALLLAVVFTGINAYFRNFENEGIFITFTLILITVFAWSGMLPFKKPFHTVTFLLIIPVVLLTEIFVFKAYNQSATHIHTTALSQATEIMPASGRALDYAEMPVNKNTPMTVRAGTALVTLALYIKLLILPHPLSFYYGYDMVPLVPLFNTWAFISLLIHAVLLGLALFRLKKDKILSFGLLFYLISISMFSNMIAPIAGLMAERLVFVASLGFCIALTGIMMKIFKISVEKKSNNLSAPNGFWITFVIITLLYSVLTFSRNSDWKNHLTLYEADIPHLDRSAQAHNLYASALIDYTQNEKNPAKRTDMYNKAIAHFSKALQVYPAFYNASLNLSKAYFYAERYDEAIPAFENTLKIDSSEYMIYMYLGIIYDQKNQNEKAESYYLKTIEKEPLFVDAYTNLSALYMKVNNTAKALQTNLKIYSLNPNAYDPVLNIGKIYFSAGDLPNARTYFEKALKLSDKDKNLVNALYEINKAMGEEEKAQYYLRKLNGL